MDVSPTPSCCHWGEVMVGKHRPRGPPAAPQSPSSMQGATQGPGWIFLAALAVFALTTQGRCCQGLEQGAREQPRLLAVLLSVLLPKAFPEAAVPAQSLAAGAELPVPPTALSQHRCPWSRQGLPAACWQAASPTA